MIRRASPPSCIRRGGHSSNGCRIQSSRTCLNASHYSFFARLGFRHVGVELEKPLVVERHYVLLSEQSVKDGESKSARASELRDHARIREKEKPE